MRIYKNKPFARFARRSGISDVELCKAVRDANLGLIDADLGGGVIKQRIARRGAGKSGGFRTLILFRVRELAIFVHGFAKNDLGNIRQDEFEVFREAASLMLLWKDAELGIAVNSGALIEVKCNGKSEKVS